MARTRGARKRDMLHLQHLPTEILLEIVKQLPKRDCYNLAVTCKALQPAAESIIWRSITINYKGTLSSKAHDRKLKQKRQILGLRSHRLAAVRRLDIWSYPGVTAQFMGLLNDVWPTLETLSISLHGDVDQMESAFEKLKQSSTVRNVQFHGVEAESAPIIAHICRAAPEIRTLFMMLFCSSQGGPVKVNSDDWSNLCPNLKYARLDGDLEYRDWVVKLIAKADTLVLEDATYPEFFYEPPSSPSSQTSNEDVESEGRTFKARRLMMNVPDEDMAEFCEECDGTNFDFVEELFVMPSHLYRTEDCQLEFIDIPPFPKLKAIHLPVEPSEGNGLFTLANPFRPLHPSLVDRILRAPSLEMVFFGVMNQKHIDYDVEGWCPKRVNGCLIRTYVNGNDTLFHIRRLDLLDIPHVKCRRLEFGMLSETETVAPDDIEYVDTALPDVVKCNGKGCRLHEWQDFTSFRGTRVPRKILAQLCHTQNEDRNWTTPGRGLPLSAEAWNILIEWHGQAEPSPAPPKSLTEMRRMRRGGWEDMYAHSDNDDGVDEGEDHENDDISESDPSETSTESDGDPWY